MPKYQGYILKYQGVTCQNIKELHTKISRRYMLQNMKVLNAKISRRYMEKYERI